MTDIRVTSEDALMVVSRSTIEEPRSVAGKVPEWAPSNVNIPFASVVTDR